MRSTRRSETGDRFSLKDHLFNPDTVAELAGRFEAAGVFPAAPFAREVTAGLGPLGLKERIALIAEVLGRHLPPDFPTAAGAIRAALPPPLDPTLSDDDFGSFLWAPLGDYVVTAGLEAHRDLSLDLIEELTQRFSMEFALRAFLNRWPDETLARLERWADHPHYHVRRLVSEGTRPRLPWGAGITLDPGRALPLLDRLHADPTRFVTRSVANHLNDISKSDPATVLGRLQDWREARRQDPKELNWMARHALRGLIRAGHPGAMEHLGYRPDAKVTLTGLSVTPSVLRGGAAEIALTLEAARPEAVIVDYAIDFARPSGRASSKVYKLKVAEVRPGRPLRLTKRHVFKDDATTFTLHPGRHTLSVQVNGRVLGTATFDLR